MRFVLLIGGFLFDQPYTSRVRLFKQYRDLILKLSEIHEFCIVTGGGSLARESIKLLDSFGVRPTIKDKIGIMVTVLNASILTYILQPKAVYIDLNRLDDVIHHLESGKIVVTGGLSPGQSTDAVAALLSELIGAEILVKATDVDGLYSTDPRIDKNAVKIDNISVNELIKLLSKQNFSPGTYEVFDLVAAKILKRSGIPCRIVDGRNVENVLYAIEGKEIGTLIFSSGVEGG
ncbi:MAG: UMP kinase [Thermoproteota archaeon]|nr:MAG: UMP kinase [Candidatus Korarchaeota archaeon]